MNIGKDLRPEECVAKDAYRPTLASLYLDVENDRLIAADGWVLAVVPANCDKEDVSGPITPLAIKLARKLRPKNPWIQARKDSVRIVSADMTQVRNQEPIPMDSIEKLLMRESGKSDDDYTTITVNWSFLLRVVRAVCAKDRRRTRNVRLKVPKESGQPLRIESPNMGSGVGYVMPLHEGIGQQYGSE